MFVVDAGTTTVGGRVGKQNSFQLIKLVGTNDDGFFHDPPSHVLARWFGQTTVVTIKVNGRHESLRIRIEPIGGRLWS